MNKTTNVLIVVIVGVLALAGVGFLLFNDTDKNNETEDAIMKVEGVMSEEETDTSELMVAENNNITIDNIVEPTEGAVMYELSDGSEVSYTVQKRFLSREDDVVVGTTTAVSGTGWLDFENNQGNVTTNFDFADLVSDSPKRDDDILPLFVDTSVNMIASITDLETLEKNTAFSVVIPAEVTINNVTETVDFNVTGIANDDSITAEGTATINMSDFNINPPSLANVYTVDDETDISFTINAVAIEDSVSMEEGSAESIE